MSIHARNVNRMYEQSLAITKELKNGNNVVLVGMDETWALKTQDMILKYGYLKTVIKPHMVPKSRRSALWKMLGLVSEIEMVQNGYILELVKEDDH